MWSVIFIFLAPSFVRLARHHSCRLETPPKLTQAPFNLIPPLHLISLSCNPFPFASDAPTEHLPSKLALYTSWYASTRIRIRQSCFLARIPQIMIQTDLMTVDAHRSSSLPPTEHPPRNLCPLGAWRPRFTPTQAQLDRTHREQGQQEQRQRGPKAA